MVLRDKPRAWAKETKRAYGRDLVIYRLAWRSGRMLLGIDVMGPATKKDGGQVDRDLRRALASQLRQARAILRRRVIAHTLGVAEKDVLRL